MGQKITENSQITLLNTHTHTHNIWGQIWHDSTQISRAVKITETESSEGLKESCCLMGTELQFCKMKKRGCVPQQCEYS